MTFPKPIDWNKIQAYTQNSDKLVHSYYTLLHITKKKRRNSGLLSYVYPTQVVFNSVFINGLNQDFSPLLGKKDQHGMGKMSTPDIVNMESLFSQTLDRLT